jgi:hypothetical protein
MFTKNIEKKQVRRTEIHKYTFEETRTKKGHSPYGHLFFGSSLAVICFVLLFVSISVASATTIYVATDGTGDYNCDGIDDQIEINLAIGNASSGDTVHLKAGTYILNYGFDGVFGSGCIDMKDGITLEGDGDTTILKLIDNYEYSEYIALISTSHGQIDNVIIRNLQLDANLPNNPYCHKGFDGSYGILLFGPSDSLIESVTIIETSLDGIFFTYYYGENCTIRNCTVKEIGHDAIRPTYQDDLLVENNYADVIGGAQGTGNDALRLGPGSNCIIRNNTAIGNAYALIYGTNENDVNLTIENNILTAILGPAMLIEVNSGYVLNNVTIKNNIIYDTPFYYIGTTSGIYLGGSGMLSNIYIISNTIDDTKGDGIKINNGDYIYIRNNIINNSEEYGINNTSGSNIFISYNDVVNSGISNYYGISAGTGDISLDPLFASVTRTDMILDENNDYYLKSQAGRWNGTIWVTDSVTSPCIDAGYPGDDYTNEPSPNGGRINIGAYGNTVDASKSPGEDTTPPTITAHLPTGTSVPIATAITVIFSEGMNKASAEGAFSVSPSVSGSFSWDANKMIFTPDSDLDYETTYTVNISTEAKDLAGNKLESPFTWQFTTLTMGMTLVGEWDFDEGSGVIAEDTSGNTNDGFLINMDPTTDWVAGKLETALTFDGVDDYVDCGHDASLDITDEITVMLWIKPNVVGEGGPNAGPICKAEAGVDWSWQLRYNAPGGEDYMGFQFNGDPEGSTWVSVKQNLSPGEWYHIAGTFDGTNIKCYLNGVEKDTNQISAIKSGNSTLFMGQDGWGNIFNGVVDEVKIYNRALSAEEIGEDYDAGLEDIMPPTTTYDITPTPNEDGWNNVTPVMVAFFRSDNGSGVSYTNCSKTSEMGPWTTVNISAATGADAENVTEISEGGFNVTVSDEGITTIWYYSVNNNATSETVKNLTVKIDTTPPASISDLQNNTGTTWINWTWTNPTDEDFNHTMVYLNGIFKTNTSNPYYNATGLIANTSYEIGTHTVDIRENVNTTWVNQTTKTIAHSETSPPCVTNPTATPAIILNDNGRPRVQGTNSSQLNVTVTDDTGVDTVTVDLSPIGGYASAQMTNIPGTDIWTVTVNATNDKHGTHDLVVNATDKAGYSNTSISITLSVRIRGDIYPVAGGDGVVNVQDGFCMQKYLAEEGPQPDMFVGDIYPATGDGVINVQDGFYLEKFLVDKEDAP